MKETAPEGRRMLRTLGLGLITGAADDDPSAIGTYASAGAALGPAFLWTAPVTFPMMCASSTCPRNSGKTNDYQEQSGRGQA